MKDIIGIIIDKSICTNEGVLIMHEDLQPTIRDLERFHKEKTKECVLHMLKYCFDNVGNPEANVNDAIEKWFEKE